MSNFRLNAKKPKNNAGLPTSKHGYLYLIHIEDIISMPESDEKGILASGEFKIKDGRRFHILYMTPSSQKYSRETEGDVDSRGWKKKISGKHPGDELEINEFVKNNLNQGFVAVAKGCNSQHSKIYGSKCNPLYFTGSFTDDSESKGYELTFEQTFADDSPVIFYTGNILIDEDALNPNDNVQFDSLFLKADGSNITEKNRDIIKNKLEIKPTEIKLFVKDTEVDGDTVFSLFEKEGDKYKFRPIQAGDGINIEYEKDDSATNDEESILKFSVNPDYGKNLANADLTNNATRTFTQNAPYNWNTMGNPYRITGLINADHDATFTKEVVLRDDGTMGIIPKRNFLNLAMQNTTINVNHIVPRDIKTTQFGEKVKEYLLNYGAQPFTPFRKADYEEIQTLGGVNKDKCSISDDGLLHLIVNSDDFKSVPGYDINTDLLTLQGKKILPHDKDWMVKIDVIDASASVLKNVVGIGNTELNPIAGVEYKYWDHAAHFGYAPIGYINWNTYTRTKSFSVFVIKTGNFLNTLIYASDILYYHVISSEPSFGNYFPIIKLKKPVNIYNEKNSNIKLKISYKIID